MYLFNCFIEIGVVTYVTYVTYVTLKNINQEKKIMTSIKKIKANRRNSKKSSGAITSKGKAIVAQNAVKHGIFSKNLLLEEESKEEFQDNDLTIFQFFISYPINLRHKEIFSCPFFSKNIVSILSMSIT